MAARQQDFNMKYFPVMVDIWDDEKIIKLGEEFGNESLLMFILLLGRLYKTSGYYIYWTQSICEIFCKRHNFKQNIFEDWLFKSVEIGLFDKICFYNYSIITSRKIQETFVKANPRKRFFYFEIRLFLLSTNDFLLNRTLKDKYGILILIDENKKEFPDYPEKQAAQLSTYPSYPRKINGVAVDLFNNQKTEDAEYEQIPNDVKPVPNINHVNTPWEDAVRLANTPYNEVSKEITDYVDEDKFRSYKKIINIINEEYSELHSTLLPIQPIKWGRFIDKPPFTKHQLYEGLHRLAGNGLKPEANMLIKLGQYIEYVLDDEKKANTQLNGAAKTAYVQPRIISDARNKQ